MRGIRIALIYSTLAALPVAAQTAAATPPRFEDHPVSEVFTGKPAAPIIATSEERRYRTRIREGVLTGAGVWNGSWKSSIKGNGPNFAGHHFIVRWGCGSQCVMMAIVDAKTGAVYSPPLSSAGALNVPLDNLSSMEVDFRPDSSLLILRDACRDSKNRASCGVYYFNWKDNRFSLVKFVSVDAKKGDAP